MIATNLKQDILRAFGSTRYASVMGLRANLNGRKPIPPASLYVTLHRLTASQILFDAGKGWYSTIAEPFRSHHRGLQGISRLIEKQFPQLTFSSWSTEELQPFVHHIAARFTTFVYTESDAIVPLTEFLRTRKFTAFAHPSLRDVEKYVTPSDRRVIVRPLITEEPVGHHLATIEKILVDLFLEKDRLFLMDAAEYKRVMANIALSYRINLGRMFRYADRRRVKPRIASVCREITGLMLAGSLRE